MRPDRDVKQPGQLPLPPDLGAGAPLLESSSERGFALSRWENEGGAGPAGHHARFWQTRTAVSGGASRLT